jgi:hypothetical protein
MSDLPDLELPQQMPCRTPRTPIGVGVRQGLCRTCRTSAGPEVRQYGNRAPLRELKPPAFNRKPENRKPSRRSGDPALLDCEQSIDHGCCAEGDYRDCGNGHAIHVSPSLLVDHSAFGSFSGVDPNQISVAACDKLTTQPCQCCFTYAEIE